MHKKLPLLLPLQLSLTACPTLADKRIFLQGAPLIGGTNGMHFDHDNNLHVAQVYGRTISKLDIDSGEILDKLSYNPEQGDLVEFPDDIVLVQTVQCITLIQTIIRRCLQGAKGNWCRSFLLEVCPTQTL